MADAVLDRPLRRESYGQYSLSKVDRLGLYLSKRTIIRHLPGHEDLDVLDLGCGHDALLLRALQPYMRFGLGIDVRVSEESLKVPKLALVESHIEAALPEIDDQMFDLVLLISVLEHLSEPKEILRHCRRVLRPDGSLMVNVPTWRGKFFLELSAFKLGASPALEMDDHKMYYDQRDLWPMLVAAGFKPSRIKMHYHKFGLNLFAVAQESAGSLA